ncbi:MAG: class II fumarate hydratase [Candidatus Lokiarchaeota archaeon]|nr:class II fumarate hydratase [Candidatus Lokiarchaeota archaeon]
MEFRIEKDILGEKKIPAEVYWGINTQRALENFKISGKKFPEIFIQSLAELKKACLQANKELDLIDTELYSALLRAVNEILIEKMHLDQFPIDIFQSGSGTQTNMNMNEVLANRANQILGHPMGKKYPVHPNDHVNKSQSSNDVIPSTMHISLVHVINERLIPTLERLYEVLSKKISEFSDVVKVGRTHLQDAVPIPLSLEFEVYRNQIQNGILSLGLNMKELLSIPIGGTALGTGLNSHKDFPSLTVDRLSKITKYQFTENSLKAEGIASHNSIVRTSGLLRSIALSILKIANDIRWMGSGPRAGLSELIIPHNEPGSSIMPGKINPTQSEMLIQVCLQILGNDTIIVHGEAYGSVLDLNVCKPLIIVNLLESVEIFSNGIDSFVQNCLQGMQVNRINIENQLQRSLMIVTKLAPLIGYDKASQIAQKAYKENKSIKDVVLEENIEFDEELDELLDPKKMV